MKTTLFREGAYSSFFDFSAHVIKGGERIEIATQRGIAAYPPHANRIVTTEIKNITPSELAGESIQIELHNRESQTPRLLGSWKLPITHQM
ncbi:MAG: hypothetical protein MI747_13285 [Desulfobacterales bacterium]|nr:hypothetical protein [Desulfobacterales bacterium]